MSKPTPEQIYAAALKVATETVKELAEAYANARKKYVDQYEELPDADDFFAWLECYDWSRVHVDRPEGKVRCTASRLVGTKTRPERNNG